MTVSPNGFWHLSLPHSLFLGGVLNVQILPLSLREKGSFVGCIQKVIFHKPHKQTNNLIKIFSIFLGRP